MGYQFLLLLCDKRRWLVAGIVRIAGPLSIPQLLRAGKMDQVQNYFFAVLVGAIFWCLSIVCICIGIIIFYGRILTWNPVFDAMLRYSSELQVCGVWPLSSGTTLSAIHHLISDEWSALTSVNYQTFLLVTSILEILITVSILAMPIRPILKLSLDLYTRLSVLGIFFLGGL
ncbi:hypothetical protein DE146DRAFT_54872 [Phaeosphaeria sp. MPI-PUGE-AT-0046c]|nr:hypothetical protein DE146DRAFT_54872 [Phaeosphaeria sp. MPI-PUGE-AT-0046c]